MRTGLLLPYLPACTAPGGCTWSQGVYLVQWGYLVRGACICPGGVYLVPGGVPSQGVYVVPGGVEVGVYLPRGVTCPGTPPGSRQPPCEQNDKQV